MVDVPREFLDDFESKFPSLATLQDATLDKSLVFGKAGLGNVVKYTAFQAARRIETIGVSAPAMGQAATVLFDEFGRYMGAVGNMQEIANPPEVLVATGEAFTAMASALGVFESIPIVGMILNFGLQIADMALQMYKFANTLDIEAFPMGYNREVDQDWTRESLLVHQSEDLTRLFLPVNDASEGINILNVEVDKSGPKDILRRAIYVPQGPGTSNLGGLPNTPSVPKGWELNYQWNPRTRPQGVPWSHFMPSTQQASVISWQGLLSNTRACYLVDAVQVEDAWNTWQQNMMLWGWGTRYSGDDRIRMSMLSRPPVDYATQQKIGQAGFRQLVPFWSGDGMSKSGGTAGSKPHFGPLLGDVAAWAAKAQLGRRQRKYLGTLMVAYCSEHDPAFRSDPLLADLLRERRMLLLDHPDARYVDLALVVDDDYRSAISTRQGPNPLADAPRPSPTGPGGLSGASPGSQAPLPAVLTDVIPSAKPFLGGSERSYSSSGDSLKNAALLALLGFMVR